MRSPGEGVHVAVVGYGYWGSKHVRVLCSMPSVAVTVVDEHTGRLAEALSRHPGIRVAEHVHDVLDDVDAVVVATPPGSHAAVALAALDAGCHVLVEKPLTTTVPDAETLVDRARRADVRLMVGNTFEYNPAVARLREIVRSGVLGRILYIDTARLSLGRYQSDVNVVWDLAPHDISIVSYLLDEMPAATAVWAQRNIGRRHADIAYLRLSFERSRTQAFVHVSWLDPNKVRRVTVVGDRKMAVYNDLSDTERIRIYDAGVDSTTLDGSPEAHAMPVTYRTGDITSLAVPYSEPLLVQDQHFLSCVRTGETPRTPGSRGLDIVRVLATADDMGGSWPMVSGGFVPAPIAPGSATTPVAAS
ncbi:Gfo/Idh/MocA family oxidoreductase [Pseudonocardia nematodicida]|uniref:Gfo/Idh/MocA family oxidoreductase n=1 Tax=Pseudonocardia nematodicida TaxID=1206997 RepID=A0ABV1K5L5_9PSEU